MAQYRVLQKSFINNSLVEEGAIVEFDGVPGDNLEPVKKGKKGAAAPADETQGDPSDAPQGQDGN